MLKVYLSTEDGLKEQASVRVKGSWISLVNPVPEERAEVSRGVGIPPDFLEYPLDEEEISRIEFDDSGVLVIIRVPVMRGTVYDTIPLGVLEDVITENKQAIEMGDIYTSILNSTMDAFASVISNNLNIVMKFLTAVTILLMIPTTVASFYGMNVLLPWQNSPHAFTGVVLASALLSMVVIVVFRRRHMF